MIYLLKCSELYYTDLVPSLTLDHWGDEWLIVQQLCVRISCIFKIYYQCAFKLGNKKVYVWRGDHLLGTWWYILTSIKIIFNKNIFSTLSKCSNSKGYLTKKCVLLNLAGKDSMEEGGTFY